jgi:thiol-disulfide isomerase/thioredoxin
VTNDVFADYEVTMVNIWASYCNPCVNEMPDLAELNGEYQDQGFQIVGIILDATDSKGSVDDAVLADAMDIIESTGADYTHIIPSAAMLGAYLRNISSVPTTVFVNSEGGIIGSAYVGSRSKADWAAIIDEKLGK